MNNNYLKLFLSGRLCITDYNKEQYDFIINVIKSNNMKMFYDTVYYPKFTLLFVTEGYIEESTEKESGELKRREFDIAMDATKFIEIYSYRNN